MAAPDATFGGVAPQEDSVPAVVVENVSKTFALPQERVHTLKERALHPLRRTRSEPFRALRNVSFEVRRGEFFGLVGRNGSGKSTLLKCLAGIYRADSGRISMRGRLSTFIELGVGFNADLAARDNVILNGIMLGLSPREAEARFERVIDFAELEEFVDLKLKNYSSGMQVRLAFAVMAQVDADVLLIDEVLAVGDAAFQQKCFDVFERMRDEGRTIVFVTHDMAAVQRFCHRALLIERGDVLAVGEPDRVARSYLELNFEREIGSPDDESRRTGDGRARILEAWMEDEHGMRSSVLAQGLPCSMRAVVEFDRPVENPSFGVAWVNEFRQNLFVASTLTRREPTGRFEAGERVELCVAFENAFGPGRYNLSMLVAGPGGDHDVIDRWEAITAVVVAGTRPAGGLVDLPHDLRLERVGAPAGPA